MSWFLLVPYFYENKEKTHLIILENTLNQQCPHFSACELLSKWQGENDLPGLKTFIYILSMLYIYIMCSHTLDYHIDPYGTVQLNTFRVKRRIDDFFEFTSYKVCNALYCSFRLKMLLSNVFQTLKKKKKKSGTMALE